MANEILFYRAFGKLPSRPTPLAKGYSCRFWHPSLRSYKPASIPGHPKFLVWWLFHQLRLFSNRGYRILLVEKNGEIAHYSFVFPKSFRFPFMARSDLQVGDVWTSAAHRNRGLATFGLNKIVESIDLETTRIWYLTSSDNPSSAKVAEKAGFTLHGKGIRHKRLGLNFLGAYQLSIVL